MSQVLITGADGHLGRYIVRWLLDHTEFSLLLWVRATDADKLTEKQNILQQELATGRCTIYGSDLVQDAPFAAINASSVTHVIHTAAETTFGISQNDAQKINVDGTARLLEWSRAANRLEQIVLLSTIYSCGLRGGVLEELPLNEPEAFANHYEWSKWASERLLLDRFQDLPWQIHRIGTVIADDQCGRVTQYNALHNTLRLVFYGLLSVVPGLPSTRLYMTTSDFSAAACAHLMLTGEPSSITHISDGGGTALRLGSFLDTVYECFLQDERFRKARILKPLLCDWPSFSTLLEGTSQFSGILGQSMNSVAPFAPQLYVDRNVHIDRQRAALPGLALPPVADILPRMCQRLIASRWGLKDHSADAK